VLLCDLVIRQGAFRAQPERLGYPRGAGGVPAVRAQLDAAATMAERIALGSRFVLGDDVIGAAVQALMSRPRSLRDCTSVLRVPWPAAFVEWREPARVEARRALGVAHDNGEDVALRCGFLVEADAQGRAGTVRPCWSHREAGLAGLEVASISPVFFRFDFGRIDAPPRPGDTVVTPEERRDSDLFQRWSNSPADVAALEDMNRAFAQVGMEDARRLAAAQAVRAASPVAAAQRMFDRMLADVAGEAMTFVAAIILLTSRNGTESVPGEDRSKLNRARARRGETPLQEHVVVHMRLSRSERHAEGGQASGHGTRASPRLHTVSGHPVCRGGSIFWRRAHTRGLASVRPQAGTRTVHVSL